MALIVGAISPDGTIVSVVNTTTLGVNIDLIGTMGESEDGSGLSQVFNKACIDGGDMDVSVPYLPNVVGRWRFSYAILHYFPAAGGDYTYENGKVCLSQPISGMYDSPAGSTSPARVTG